MRSLGLIAGAAVALCVGLGAAWADTVKLTATLEPDKQGGPGKGTAKLSIDTASKTLTMTVEYSGLSAPPAMAAFLSPPPKQSANPGTLPIPLPAKVASPINVTMKLTDPALVTFEMDCGWVTVGGGDPVAYLHKYPNRISMLHLKGFKKAAKPFSPTAQPVPTELGRGSIDYGPIFAAAKKGTIKHYFVEQEAFDVPWEESLRIDADYIRKL